MIFPTLPFEAAYIDLTTEEKTIQVPKPFSGPMSRRCSSSLNFILQASFFFLQTCNVFWGSSLLTDELQLLEKSLLLLDELKTVPVCFSHSWPGFIIQQGQLLLYIRNSLKENKYISKCRRERQEEIYNMKPVNACAFFLLNIKPRKFRGVWEDCFWVLRWACFWRVVFG